MKKMGEYEFFKLLVICLVVAMNSHQVYGDNRNINLTFVANAVDKGAVCNDGSPAAYFYDPGFGDGVHNWIIFLQGGSWCNSTKYCEYRLRTQLGSTVYHTKNVTFEKMRSTSQIANPDFYNWHRILVVYCDGSSYMGNATYPTIASRGARIFTAVMEDLLEKGMANATNAILSGHSSGGLAAILHCDDFRSLLPPTARVKCLIDSGFFLHAPKLHGAQMRADYFASVIAYHGFTDKLSQSCTSRMNASLCIFPEHFIKDIRTPIFLIESKFDIIQVNNYVSDDPNLLNCTKNVTLCTPSNFQTMKDYSVAVTEILQDIRDSSSVEMFVHPCLHHGHLYEKFGWGSSYKFRNKTIEQAVGDWFYDRSCSLFQEIDTDHEFPLSSNCTKLPNI